jgi:hypothetical protein
VFKKSKPSPGLLFCWGEAPEKTVGPDTVPLTNLPEVGQGTMPALDNSIPDNLDLANGNIRGEALAIRERAGVVFVFLKINY